MYLNYTSIYTIHLSTVPFNMQYPSISSIYLSAGFIISYLSFYCVRLSNRSVCQRYPDIYRIPTSKLLCIDYSRYPLICSSFLSALSSYLKHTHPSTIIFLQNPSIHMHIITILTVQNPSIYSIHQSFLSIYCLHWFLFPPISLHLLHCPPNLTISLSLSLFSNLYIYIYIYIYLSFTVLFAFRENGERLFRYTTSTGIVKAGSSFLKSALYLFMICALLFQRHVMFSAKDGEW